MSISGTHGITLENDSILGTISNTCYRSIFENSIIPDENYEIEQSYLPNNYSSIENRIIFNFEESEVTPEKIINIPIVNKLSIKIKKPKPLSFVSVQDSEGFYAI